MENSVKCYIFIFIIVTAAIGFPMLYYGSNCSTSKEREEKKDSTCKDIHNDDSAGALFWIGFILWLPLMIISFIVALYCACLCLLGICAGDSGSSSNNRVQDASDDSGGAGGAFVLGAVGALVGMDL